MPLIKKDLDLIRDVVKNALDTAFKDPKNPLRVDMQNLRTELTDEIRDVRTELKQTRTELKSEIRKVGRKVGALEKIHPRSQHQATL